MRNGEWGTKKSKKAILHFLLLGFVVVFLLGFWWFRHLPQIFEAPLGLRPDVSFEGVHLSEWQGNQAQFYLRAQKADFYQALGHTQLYDVSGTVPRSGTLPEFEFYAQRGLYQQRDGRFTWEDIRLSTKTSDSLIVQAGALDWVPGAAFLDCRSGVTFWQKNVSGQAARAAANLENGHVKLWDGVRATIQP